MMRERCRWVALVAWYSGDQEEIDVWARTRAEARTLVQVELDRDYQPNGRIVRLVQRDPDVTVWSV